MAGSRAVEAAVGAPKHHRIRNVIIVVAVLALIFATGAIICTIY